MSPIEPQAALARLLERIEPVGTETVMGSSPTLAGRVLASPIRLDRDSPACDISAMDGFAVRFNELQKGPVQLVGECRIGQAPEELAPAAARRIYTGSPVPRGADTVLRLERGFVDDQQLRLDAEAELTVGADIRRQGENAKAGDIVLPIGIELTPAAIGAMATIGPREIDVYRSLRVAVVTTGNELISESDNPPPWQIRDSNGPVLRSLLGSLAWVETVELMHADDSLDAMAEQLKSAVARYDIVLLTGGVSKGAYDFVPPAVQQIGGQIVFHRIAARPGQPTLGALVDGTPVIGLPGNPLAVLCAGRRLVVPVLRKLAGLALSDPPAATVCVEKASDKTLSITWWRPVTLTGEGIAKLASLRGSGDVCGPATTDGFVEVPPETDGSGPYAYYPWHP